ncbi:MAG: hypothetical protein N2039_04265 [Gemmataceae bacterium]|nr:hypothetical protein [Gemmataceae bacterium]
MMLSTATGRGRLYSSLKDLRLRWEEVRQGWNDPVSRDFEEKLLEPLAAQAQAALRAMDQLSLILHQMQQECA